MGHVHDQRENGKENSSVYTLITPRLSQKSTIKNRVKQYTSKYSLTLAAWVLLANDEHPCGAEVPNDGGIIHFYRYQPKRRSGFAGCGTSHLHNFHIKKKKRQEEGPWLSQHRDTRKKLLLGRLGTYRFLRAGDLVRGNSNS